MRNPKLAKDGRMQNSEKPENRGLDKTVLGNEHSDLKKVEANPFAIRWTTVLARMFVIIFFCSPIIPFLCRLSLS